MKKGLWLLMLWGSAIYCFAQATGTLDNSLTAVKSYVERQVPTGTVVLITDFAAPSRELSGYIADTLSTRLFNGNQLRVVERSVAVLQSLMAETAYQLSGEVDDNSIQSIGHKTGAEVLVTGSIDGTGDQYRLSIKITRVRTGELQGQWSNFIQSDTVLQALLESIPPPPKPQWTGEPLTARDKYEPQNKGVSEWYYDMGISSKAASEQLARTRARQNVQQMIAENIASEMKARIDVTALSIFQSSVIEDAEFRIEAALTNSIKTKVPRYETLEWHVEHGKLNGKDWYIAYVLVRFPRRDILDLVEKLDPEAMADRVIRELNIPAQAAKPDAKSELVEEMKAVRDYALEGIKEALTEH
jgi:hypothetical protein